jgi:hypothetical protein
MILLHEMQIINFNLFAFYTFAAKKSFLMKSQLLIIVLFFSIILNSTSQDSIAPTKIKYTFGGYVKADLIYDTRQVVDAREGFLAFYPKNCQLDREGKDINNKASFNQYAMTTRLNLKVDGPMILGAKPFAFVEGDFTGASNAENNSLRLRHAYIKLSWRTTRLLVGQYWHPLDVPEALPYVISLNTGAPFHSFTRQPQIRFEQSFWKFNFIAVAASQRDYINTGPIGSSANYLRNSVIPNLHAQLHLQLNENLVGLGVDYKQLTPRLITDSGYKANESLNNLAFLAFAKLSCKFLTFKIQGIYGQSLNDHLMLGGYGVTSVDTITNRKKYVPLNYINVWISIMTNGKRWQFGVFGGYAKNLGAAKDIIGSIYARDPDIAYAYRISPIAVFNSGKFSFAFEGEYTVAAYGIPDTRYHFKKSKKYANLRLTLAAIYNF